MAGSGWGQRGGVWGWRRTGVARPIEENLGGQGPAAVDRGLGGAEPSCGLLGGKALCQAQKYVGDVGWVAGDDACLGAAPNPVDDELPDRGAGLDVFWPRVEVGEGPFEHNPG